MSILSNVTKSTEDDKNINYEDGIKIWREPMYQKYVGNFLHSNMHGTGFYYVLHEKSSSFYSGQLYNNKFQGYGKIFYQQGTCYEGMFKDSKRFGPGIVSYPDTSQDVGFWNGNSLIRLTYTMRKKYVPMMCPTPQSKLKLIRYRKVIPVMTEPQSPITNPHVRNEHSLFFDRQLYDSIQNTTIEVIEDVESLQPEGSVEEEVHDEAELLTPQQPQEEITEGSFEEQVHNKAKLEALQQQREEISIQLKAIEEIRTQYQEEIGRCIKCCSYGENSSNESLGMLDHPCHCTEPAFSYSNFEESINHERFLQNVVALLDDLIAKECQTPRHTIYKTVKMDVQHLLAWNNENIITKILLLCFKHRESEDVVNFNVKSLLVGDRNSFGDPGSIEEKSVDFLLHCSENEMEEVRKDLYFRKVNPSLSDGRGNSGVHFAIAFDSVDAVKVLANAGANLNALNDECLTPLVLALLRYIAKLNGIEGSWENVFLQETVLNEEEMKEVTQWRPHESFENLRAIASSHASDSPKIMKRTSKSSRKGKGDDLTEGKVLKDEFVLATTFEERKGPEQQPDPALLEKIRDTVDTLLFYGANANLGQVPLPPILLAVFTDDLEIVGNLLKHGANPNLTNDDLLTPLHVVASRPFSTVNAQIAEKLLYYGADPNPRTCIKFWSEQDEALIGDYEGTGVQVGKTPLHMITLRTNPAKVARQCELVQVFLNNGASPDAYFLGHTPVSIAVLKGNLRLIETFRPYISMNQQLGEDMGNLLTIFGLRRFPSPSIDDTCRTQTMDLLVKLGANPFEPVYHHANIYEFFEHEWGHNEGKRIFEEKNEFRFNRTYVKSQHSKKKKKVTKCAEPNKQTVFYSKQIGRDILSIMYQNKIMNHLHFFAENDLLFHRCMEKMARFFTIDEALNHIRILIGKGMKFTDKLVLRILFLINNWTPRKARMPLIKLKQKIEELRDDLSVSNDLTRYIFDSEPNKYHVCFHCLKATDVDLITCPCCGAVQFCSQNCNLYNNKLITRHTCGTIFYDSVIQKSQNYASIGLPAPRGIQFLVEDSRLMKDTREQEKRAQLLRTRSRSKEKLKILKLKKKQLLSKLTCGFHCGHLIPNIKLDDEGNIIREQQFCDCYPLSQRLTEPPSPKPETEEDTFNREVKELSELVNALKQKKGYGKPFAVFFGDLSETAKHPREPKLKKEKKAKAPRDKKKKVISTKMKRKGKEWEKNLSNRLKKLRGVPTTASSLASRKKEKGRKKMDKDYDKLTKGKRDKQRKDKEAEEDKRKKKKKGAKDDESDDGTKGKGKKKSKAKKGKDRESRKRKRDDSKDKKKRGKSKEGKRSKSRDREKKRSKSRGKERDGSKRRKGLKSTGKSKRSKSRDKKRAGVSGERKKGESRLRGKDGLKGYKTGAATTESQERLRRLDSTGRLADMIGFRGPSTQTDRITRTYAYFLELLAKYFPDFDFNCLFMPFACFIDGQLYYKFTDGAPYYCRTYSSI